ncbi:MAG: FIST N-terminal domain-containing protein [Candidatus Omnitrophota bacterium]|nr:FIST N-terminal domain-containing protein [Candidatus Omnitrophota bacterium]
MIRAATAHSESNSISKAAEQACHTALAKAKIQSADIAFVFTTCHEPQKHETLLQTISRVTGAKNIIGSSAYGVITEEAELESDHAVAIMLVASDFIECTPFLMKNLQESSLTVGRNIGDLIRGECLLPSFLMLLPDAFSFQSHMFFDGFEQAYGYLPMIGGISSEHEMDQKVYQFMGKEATYDAIAGAIFGGNLRVTSGITQSCQPFGEPLQITRATGNEIYEMNGRPAYDIFLEHVSKIESGNPEQAFQNVFLGLPTRSFQTDFAESHYLIRNILSVNAKKGMLSCAAPVEQGDFVTFTVRDPKGARQNMTNMLDNLKHRVEPDKPDFGFYFNFCTRGQTLYGEANQDISMIRKFFPDVPIIGFFTYGELAPLDYVNHLHHYSGVLSLVSHNR